MSDKTQGIKRAAAILQWALVPIVMFVAMEIAIRARVPADPRYFQEVRDTVRTGPIDFIFLGTSRTAAAVGPDIFAKVVSEMTGIPRRAANGGTGYTTIVEAWLALRELYEQYPQNMKNAVILIEAPMGLPPIVTDRIVWVDDRHPEIITPFMRAGDIPGLLRSTQAFEVKARLLVDYTMKWSRFWVNRKKSRDIAITGFNVIALRFLKLFDVDPTEKKKADLAGVAGIVTDENFMKIARKQAKITAERSMKYQFRIEDWENSGVAKTVELVHANGGRVLFFDMPMSEVMANIYRTDIRRQDIAEFNGWMAKWKTPYLKPAFDFPDEAFPDLWHLGGSHMPAYTESLAKSWVEYENGK